MQGTDSLPPDDGVDAQQRLRQELSRLRLKLEHSTDKDIKAVLQMRIDQIVAELPPVPVSPKSTSPQRAPEPEPAAVAEPAATEDEPPGEQPGAALSPAQLQEVDRLIRQARVEKMRGNAVEATKMLQTAATLAPSSAPVLEALGDNLIERRQVAPAIKAYKRALQINPKNVGLEEKLATAVLRIDASGSVEDQLRMGLNDSPFLTRDDIVARTPYAVVLSAICPGVGHLALGKTGAGASLLTVWVLCWVWLLIKRGEVADLARMVAGKTEHVDTSVFFALFVMLIVWMGALASLKPRSAQTSRRTVEHPVPPANLPFE